MHQHIRHLVLTATLLLSLTPTIKLPRTSENWAALAQEIITPQDRINQALRLNRIGVRQLNSGQFQKALQTFEQALIILKAIF